MRKVILDTSFILTAVRQKIDFFREIEERGMHIIIPGDVVRELKGLGAKLAIKILEQNKFEIIEEQGKDADNIILKFAEDNPRAIVATLDAGMKKKLKNRKLIIRQKKKLEVT